MPLYKCNKSPTMTMTLSLKLLLSIICVVVKCQRIPDNPCGSYFAYVKQNNVYFGVVSIPYDGSRNLYLSLNVSMVGFYQNLKLRIDMLTPSNQILTSDIIRYQVNFPLQNVLPKVTQIFYNGRVYCQGPPEPLTEGGVTNLWASLIYTIKQYTVQGSIPNTIVNEGGGSKIPCCQETNEPITFKLEPEVIYQNPTTTKITTTTPKIQMVNNDQDSCGIANDVQTLVLNGKKTIENEFPWLVAMFHRQGVSYEFQCTANLITASHVITAGHCVQFFKAPLVAKEDILLVLGRSDLTHWATTNAVIRTALDVIPHPQYKQYSGHCDVAIIKMNEPVQFKPTIRPVCLWQFDVNLKMITGKQGLVAGWGHDGQQGSQTVPEPRKIEMPIVSQEACLRSHAGFMNLTSEMTFCAGNRDGSGPCSGDSGAGFLIKNQKKWYLRGLVSTAIKKLDNVSCDLDEFIVFVDLAKLKEWIQSNVK